MTRTRSVSVSRTIPAPPEAVFAVLADPRRHPEIDGSGSVVASRDAEAGPLVLGSRFGMDMRIGIPYRMTNEVVEYEQDRLIAWQHWGRHRWRYRLEPVDGGTEVTETFDWSTSWAPWFIEIAGWPRRHPPAMAATLERLEEVVARSS